MGSKYYLVTKSGQDRLRRKDTEIGLVHRFGTALYHRFAPDF